jgi:hypothetical protein
MKRQQKHDEAVTQFVAQLCVLESRRAMAEFAEEVYVETKRNPHRAGSSDIQAFMNAGLRSYLSEPREEIFSDDRVRNYLNHLRTVRVALRRIVAIPA